MKKVLIITPKFPFPIRGASESDRAYGIQQFLDLGFEVKVITKISKDKIDKVEPVARELDIDIYPVTYKFSKSRSESIKRYLKALFTNPALLDGAAREYSDPELVKKFKEVLKHWQPDYVWLDMSFMWYLIRFVDRQKTKVITRSQAFEASHFIEEEGISLKNLGFYFAKFFTEKQTARKSDLILAITPEEADIYKKLGAKNVATLPLRGLPHLLKDEKGIKNGFPLNVFFAGSTYGVQHNKKALKFLLSEIIPEVNKKAPGKFIFNIFGRKFPDEFKKYLTDNIKYLGFVDDYEEMMEQMDIAIIPALAGRGMQQKIFEPLVRGIPVIASPRALAGYHFKDDRELLYATQSQEFVDKLLKMQDFELRERLSRAAIKQSKELFSKEILDKIVLDNIEKE
ncbi:glycosyltransferase [bacterium]|nr:glycosyltransferase [bacterium]